MIGLIGWRLWFVCLRSGPEVDVRIAALGSLYRTFALG
jgi:hypothetical protein